MIERVIGWSMRRPRAVLAASLAAAAAGAAALFATPLDVIPDLAEPQVLIGAAWPGRGPLEVEERVTRPLSRALLGLPGVRAVRGSSESGMSMVDVVLEDGADMQLVRSLAAERIAAAIPEFPERVLPALGPDAAATGHVFWYTLEGGDLDLGERRELHDAVVLPALRSVPGVAEVAAAGGMKAEWQVESDPLRLRAFDVTLEELTDAVRRASSGQGAGGTAAGPGGEAVVVSGGIDGGRARDAILRAVVAERRGSPVRVGDVASVSIGPAPRRCILERDGSEAVGGVVVMARGGNPREVCAALRARAAEVSAQLPGGVHIAPFYDRSELVRAAVGTVGRALAFELFAAVAVIFFVMRHAGASVLVCISLPLAILLSFLAMKPLGVEANLMSLAGIAIAIGVLADQAIVLADNGLHALRAKFGEGPVRGDTRDLLLRPAQEVGRPVFFAVLVMVVSFLPVFALGGVEGRMFHPLAWTKTLVLLAVGAVTVTLLPALLPRLLRGRVRAEEDSWLVRTAAAVYRPVLSWLIGRTRVVLFLFALILAAGWVVSSRLGREFMPALDEGAILDMPVTTPRASLAQVGDDLRARNELLRSFPEVRTVVGKAGRADTATDPSPIEMIETHVGLRPAADWPRRHLGDGEAARGSALLVGELKAAGLADAAAAVSGGDVSEARRLFDARMRADASHGRLEPSRAGLSWIESLAAAGGLDPEDNHVRAAVACAAGGFAPTLSRKSREDLLAELDAAVLMPGWANIWTKPIINRIDMLTTGVRTAVGVRVLGPDLETVDRVTAEVAAVLRAVPGAVDVVPEQASGKSYLRVTPAEFPGGALVPAADLLAAVSAAFDGTIAGELPGDRRFAGAGLPVRVRYARAAREDADDARAVLLPPRSAEAADTSPLTGGASSAMPGAMAGMAHAAKPRSAAAPTAAPEVAEAEWSPRHHPEVGDAARVELAEGPAMIRSESGTLRGLVQLGVEGRDIVSFVEDARAVVATHVSLPRGVTLEWTGQYEHEVRSRRTLSLMIPAVLVSMLAILWMTYRDLGHALLVLLAVPGALAGGVFCQAILGEPFSVASWVGYIACFGMATQTGIVMLVYLRQAVSAAGGLGRVASPEALRAVVLDGAVRRMRPKLLTEATTILGVAPMLFVEGPGSEILRPMAAPVLGGILVADEVIDIFLPALFYRLEIFRLRRSQAAARPH